MSDMNERFHPTALISEGAEIGEGTTIGAYCIIGPNVKIGKNCEIRNHVIINGHTKIGDNNKFYQFCSIGEEPQDLTYKEDPTEVEIGDNNVMREYVSIHRGTMKDRQKTSLGSNCLLMAKVHLGHDVVVGDRVIMANSTNLAGHVKVGNKVIIGGGTNISQFVKVAEGAYIGGASAIDKDIPLYCTAYGNRAKLRGINIIGLRRAGVERNAISEIVDFFRDMEASTYSPRTFVETEELMKPYANNEIIAQIKEHIISTKMGIAPFLT
ncbi:MULTISPECIES: acyl-ACP--UDP-N-acetylglucosamine O-acyltransferase [Halobacteriovorax]|nr:MULTISPECIES: acyl-ACP--UDP-N-acetylglucosamine O-acyltransferase [Halobacteriovorax]AYF43459.1 acyl-[acyl-carrier-protein] [Halobacteriovorax sp. BALOs_7]